MNPLSAAMHYIARDLRVLPIRERAKEPLVAHGVHSASCDEGVIREWFTRWPTANIAIAVPQDFFVLDDDPRNGGDRELERLQLEHGPLPETIAARTGSGGGHRLFARPPGVQLRGKIGHGLDVLGAGRYFLAYPSVHPCGGRYAWTSPRGTRIAQPPEWLVRLASLPEAPIPAPRPVPITSSTVERARKYIARVPPAIQGSGGSTHTFLTAQRLVRGFALSEDTALALLVEWNATCLPPWTANDLRRKVREAVRAGRMAPGALADRGRSA